ncbi:hypothetical protein ACIA2T_04440 [Amycolatopsis japonica]|uniref:hypothetical protein n=1 Tax=Amycolatopsis japonica TaxID=208439 RepID=UPI0037AFADB4
MNELQPIANSEHEKNPERRRLFDLEAMGNQEIIDLGRALSLAAEAKDVEPADEERFDNLWRQLQANVADLPSQDLDRARELLITQASSDNEHDHDAAASLACTFHDYDYEFTRDILVQLYNNVPNEYIIGRVHELLEHRLTPEQRADYEGRLEN